MFEINIIVNNHELEAKFNDNDAANELISRMPFSHKMQDLHANEKYTKLNEPIRSTDNETPEFMEAGDIMLWHEDTLVIFYKRFKNFYSNYTRIGKISAVNLEEVLGKSDVEIRFELGE